jgi:hypothetical protein
VRGQEAIMTIKTLAHVVKPARMMPHSALVGANSDPVSCDLHLELHMAHCAFGLLEHHDVRLH